jgi:peroxiredoxin
LKICTQRKQDLRCGMGEGDRMTAWRTSILVAAVFGIALWSIGASVVPQAKPRRIDCRLTLPDIHGELRCLHEIGSGKCLVVAFLGIDCPLAERCVPVLSQLSHEFSKRAVVVGIDSNEQDTPSRLLAFAQETKMGFALLRDPAQIAADRFGAERTPEAFVLDDQQRVCYRGKVGAELRDAVAAVVAGQPVRTQMVPAVGCRIQRKPTAASSSRFAFDAHIRPILERHCVDCHRPGEIGPFSLTEWKEAAAWSATIRDVVSEGRMPPWHADADVGHFKNDARLTSEEKATLLRWIDDGCPQGPPSSPDSPRASTDWRISKPDRVLPMADAAFEVPAKGALDYQYFVVDPGFKDDMFVRAAEVRPGDRSVVHHALVSLLIPGADENIPDNLGALFNYAPGMQATQLPEGWAIRIPKGTKFQFQMHYTPHGKRTSDRTSLGLVFADPKSVTHEVRGGAVANPGLSIPPGAANHREAAEHVFGQAVRLLSVSPHMHLRGKSFRIEAVMPDGRRIMLLNVPRYDFHWQLRYEFAEPIFLPAGSRLICSAIYDNSASNPRNPDPQKAVAWGDQTTDEMLIGFFSFTLDSPKR